jgi:hypothetical protein
MTSRVGEATPRGRSPRPRMAFRLEARSFSTLCTGVGAAAAPAQRGFAPSSFYASLDFALLDARERGCPEPSIPRRGPPERLSPFQPEHPLGLACMAYPLSEK